MENTAEEDLRIELVALQSEKMEMERLMHEAYNVASNYFEELKRLKKQERSLLELIHRAAGTAVD